MAVAMADVSTVSALKRDELLIARGICIGKKKTFGKLLESLEVQKELSGLDTAAGKLSTLYYEVRELGFNVTSTAKHGKNKEVPLHTELNSILHDAQKLMGKKLNEPEQLAHLSDLQGRVDKLSSQIEQDFPTYSETLSKISSDIGRALNKFDHKNDDSLIYRANMAVLISAVKEMQAGSSKDNQARIIDLIPALVKAFEKSPILLEKTSIKDVVRKTLAYIKEFEKLTEELSVIRGKLAAVDADPNRRYRKPHFVAIDAPRKLSGDEKHMLVIEAVQTFGRFFDKRADVIFKMDGDQSPASRLAFNALEHAGVLTSNTEHLKETRKKIKKACYEQEVPIPKGPAWSGEEPTAGGTIVDIIHPRTRNGDGP